VYGNEQDHITMITEPEECYEDVAANFKCSTGPTRVFPDLVSCENMATEFLFGDPYCRACITKLLILHHAFAAAKA